MEIINFFYILLKNSVFFVYTVYNSVTLTKKERAGKIQVKDAMIFDLDVELRRHIKFRLNFRMRYFNDYATVLLQLNHCQLVLIPVVLSQS